MAVPLFNSVQPAAFFLKLRIQPSLSVHRTEKCLLEVD
nr:MAG TPA: hypothetical protein [Caudoviricetes sp.]